MTELVIEGSPNIQRILRELTEGSLKYKWIRANLQTVLDLSEIFCLFIKEEEVKFLRVIYHICSPKLQCI